MEWPPYYRQARLLVIGAALLPMLLIVLMAADGALRARRCDQVALEWFQSLDLSSPAFWPAGTAQRYPETHWPAIDMRFAPGLPAKGSSVGAIGIYTP